MADIYPQHVDGRFRKTKNVVSVVLQTLLFLTPWLTWQGRPLMMIDLQGRKLHLFGQTFWPQETHLLLLLVLMAGLTLFFVSSTMGRIWCGFACPQTLFSHTFILVERVVEGSAAKRRRLNQQPWRKKLPLKLVTWTIWGVMSVYLGITFAGYFAPIREVLVELSHGQATPFTATLIGFFTVVSVSLFGIIRGRFCTTICPYARFQSALTTAQTRMVAYDTERGEPRGKVKDPNAADCTDCKACVRVCPMGIDIREGFQFACINCASCIDACDDMMASVGRAPGLVSFTSMDELQAREKLTIRRWFSRLGPRPVIYAAMLLATVMLLGVMTASRSPFDFEVVRDSSGTTVTQTEDGRIVNRYRLRLVSRSSESQTVSIVLSKAPEGAELVATENPCRLDPESVNTLQILVICPPRKGAPVAPLVFEVKSAKTTQSRPSNFSFAGHAHR